MSTLKAFTSGKKRVIRLAGFALEVIIIFVLSFGLLNAANRVYIDIVKYGESEPAADIYSGYHHEFRIHIENDVNLGGMSLGFRIWSPDGDAWSYTGVGGYGSIHGCVAITPGCRMESAWDLDLIVTETAMDEIPPDDLILIGGISLFGYLPSGSEEHMLSIHFTPQSSGEDSVVSLCIDSIFFQPFGDFLFSDQYGGEIIPSISGPFCWCCDLGGDADNSGAINILDVSYVINYLYKNGPLPPCEDEGDANGSGAINILDVSYIINYLYKSGPAPICP